MPLMNNSNNMEYTNSGEQSLIFDFFKDYNGKLLDVGANDGIMSSNTCALLERGWKGIMIEPSPNPFKNLHLNYTKKDLLKNTVLLNYALVPDNFNKTEFYETLYEDTVGNYGLGSFYLEELSDYVKGNTSNVEVIRDPVKVNKITTTDFFKIYGYTFDFISIDVEHMNYLLVTNFPWEKINCKLICVELDVYPEELINFFKTINYKLYEVRRYNYFFAPTNKF